MNFKTRTNHNSRSGVTLLFTISMIVLFLLMGTTFVVVANDFFKTSMRRSRLSSNNIDTTALLDRAFYVAFRGPSLDDISSPLRGHDLLSDVYGYGFRGQLSGAGDTATLGSGLVILNVTDSMTNLLRNTSGGITSDSNYVDGIFNGRVISFTSGAAAGYSTRIVSQAQTAAGLQYVILRDSSGIDWTAVANGDEYIVNGREYSGRGAGASAGVNNPDGAATAILGANSLEPIMIGEERTDLTDPSGFLPNSSSPAEPYDAPDVQNWLLAGEDGSGEIIPSGHRDRLYQNYIDSLGGGPVTSVAEIRSRTMRPFYVDLDNDGEPDTGCTANAEFDFNFVRPTTTSPMSLAGSLVHGVNDADGLDVDTDNRDGNDAVWIDIGLPIQTDDQGRQFRPLVAYRIIDLDGRLNLNVHGTHADVVTGSADRQGMGVGPSDISLSGILGGDYESLLDNRYGTNGDNIPGNAANSLSVGQKLFGTPTAPNYLGGHYSTALPFLAEAPLSLVPGADNFPSFVFSANLTADAKLTANPYASDFSVGGGAGDSHFQAAELESLLRQSDIDGGLQGGRLYDDFSAVRNQVDSVTTHSFEVAIPTATSSIMELLRDRVRTEVGAANLQVVFREFVTGAVDPANRYISKEMLLGGRFDLNRILGDGLDNDSDGAADDAEELATVVQSTSNYSQPEQQQHGTPPFDLDNGGNGRTGDEQAKVIMARQLYILALLVSGDRTTSLPSTYPDLRGVPSSGTLTSADRSYRKAVAQWAVNMVDYRDSDSIMTVFEYDINPFNDPFNPANVVDGDPSTTGEADRGIVIGLERPELLITETLVAHDRQLEDTDTDPTGEDMATGSDDDYDSPRLPNTTSIIELYHPWLQTHGANNSFQALPRELTNDPTIAPDGVHLDKLAPDDTPVWRIVVRRGENAGVPNEAVRSIYFADPSGSAAPVIGEAFFPSAAVPSVAPGEYTVIGSPGNVAGRDMFTFGRLTAMVGEAPTGDEINLTRSIEMTATGVQVRGPAPGENATRTCNTIVIDRSQMSGGNVRGLSLSDPDGGYPIPTGFRTDVERDGVRLTEEAFPFAPQAKDTPFDAELGASTYHDDDDIDAIWTNGVMQDASGSEYQFRVLHLQRLADPTSAFDLETNPYVTVDIANVDLLAFNGLANNSDNGASPENGVAGTSTFAVTDGPTQMGGIERGENIADDEDRATARRMLFRMADERKDFMDDVAHSAGDGHTFSYSFNDTTNVERLETLGGRNDAYNDDTVPFGWLAWNNRPYANRMELAQVPMLSAEGLIRHFGESEMIDSPTVSMEETADKAFAYFFGDDQFGHLPGFGGVIRGGGTAPDPNRFDTLLDFVEVPNRFLGSEIYLSADVAATGPLLFNLSAPFRSIPNFRYPGKLNLNTIYSSEVWDAVRRGFISDAMMNFNMFRANRSLADGPTDIGRVYTSVQGTEFVEPGASNNRLRKGLEGGLFRENTTGTGNLFDGEDVPGTKNIEAAATFRNEVRTRLGGLTTTRSSVYAMWITIGYFEVDEFGRVGAEIGADEGTARRNRAFYMIDRSIPVASEPGKNHNVDQAVLVRTIIE